MHFMKKYHSHRLTTLGKLFTSICLCR